MRILFSLCIAMLSLVSMFAGDERDKRLVFTRPTLITVSCEQIPKWHVEIFKDEDYRFFYRDYGKAEFVPGFFVYSQKRDEWIEIKKLSTENAKLGHSPPIMEIPLQVAWDYSYLKKLDYAEIPLRTSGSITFPDHITDDEGEQAYRLDFNSGLKREEFMTRFWILKKDLDDAFGK